MIKKETSKIKNKQNAKTKSKSYKKHVNHGKLKNIYKKQKTEKMIIKNMKKNRT